MKTTFRTAQPLGAWWRLISGKVVLLLMGRQPIPQWTLDDEFELISARRMHRPRKHLMERKQAALHAELRASSRWRGL